MKRLSGLIMAMVVAANLVGCSTEKPVKNFFSKEATLVVMEPISIEKSAAGSYTRFREVDGSCQYSGKLEKTAGVWAANIDSAFCLSGPNELGSSKIYGYITLGDLKTDLPKNSQVNVIFARF